MERPFGWLPCRLLTDGLLAQMSSAARQLYLLLALAADRRGLSYYGDRRIQSVLQLGSHELRSARDELTALDLVAFEAGIYQLLSLPTTRPECPTPTSSQPSQATPAPPDATSERTASPTQPSPLHVSDETRQLLRRTFGHDFGV
jgi:hypothetical protein